MVTEGASGALEGVLGETYDVTMPASWGADGRWDNDSIVQNTVVSSGAGGLLHNVGAPSHGGADVPTSGAAPIPTRSTRPTPRRPTRARARGAHCRHFDDGGGRRR